MKSLGILFTLIISFNLGFTQNLRPYILGFETTESIAKVKQQLNTNLKSNGIEIVGEYQPASDKNRWIIVFTSSELKTAVKTIGGNTGFAATLRVAITVENGKTLISYTNPAYWGNAYFQKDFAKVKSNYTKLSAKLVSAMTSSGSYLGTEFGSKKGISAEDLQKYHYMMGMPYFEDNVELESFDSYTEAVSKIDNSIKSGVANLKMVYKVTIPGKNLTLYGFALLGESGEQQFMPIIDQGSPKHSAFLPYEVLVNDDEVLMLHGRFRIALAFPDLTMGTFSKIMSTPGYIEDMLEQLVD